MAQDWRRVAEFVKARRNALGLRQERTPGVSSATWNKIENAKETSYKTFTLAAIERALFLDPGEILRIAEGGPLPELDESVHLRMLRAEIDQLRAEMEELKRRPDGGPRGLSGAH